MKLDAKYGSLVLSISELSALGRQPGINQNILSLLPAVETDGKESIQAEFGNLGKDQQEAYAKAIAMLAAPSQIARLHYGVGDNLVTRMYFAWQPGEKSSVAVMAAADGHLAVSLQPSEKIEATLSQVLALDAKLFSDNLSMALAPPAVIVFIAVMDYFHYARHYSILTHTPPAVSFSRREIMERLADAAAADFRWPLHLLTGVFPWQVSGRFSEAEVTAALDDLCRAGLLLQNEAENKNPELTLYSLAAGAQTISDSLSHNVSLVAMSVSSSVGENEIGHEAMLLVRSSTYLWVFGIGGQAGIVAGLDAARFREVLQKFLAPPEKVAPVRAKPASSPPAAAPMVAAGQSAAPEPEANACSRCGTGNPAASKFCSKCGAPLATRTANFCPKCGDPVKAGEKFCNKCGTKLG